jgi:peroxiredoxin Q/BCP
MKILITVLLLSFLVYRSVSRAGEIPKMGAAAPGFALQDQNNQTQKLSDYLGQWVVLYFYPKDDTPGCTKEACRFRDDFIKLNQMGAKIVGISVDEVGSHEKFASKYHLPFPLLADKDGVVAEQYGALTNLMVIKIAKRYTFLIDPKGMVAKAYLNVDTSRHSQEIIDDLKLLKQ